MKRHRWRVVAATAGLAAVAAAADAPSPPGPLLPRAATDRAVVLEDGWLLRAPVDESGRVPLRAGAILSYGGVQRDAFGRQWYRLGVPGGWVRRQRWYAVLEDVAAELGGEISLLTAVPPPREPTPGEAAPAPAEVPSMPEDWWQRAQSYEALVPPERGGLVGVRAWSVPARVLQETRALAPYAVPMPPPPDKRARGALQLVGPSRLLLFWDGEAWSTGTQVRVLRPVWGLLRNPELLVDPRGPREQTGPPVPCWRLVGGLDPRGVVAGRVGAAPAPAEGANLGAPRPEERRYLGLQDLTALWRALATGATAAPLLVVPSSDPPGVVLEDASARQAVYLEQRLAGETVAALAGRGLRAVVVARAAPEGEAGATATVAVQLLAGGEVVAASATVGERPSRLEVVMEAVPADAEEIVVRVLPADPSIAVQERGKAVFERVSLAPADWPARLLPSRLLLRRVRVTGYEPALWVTRAAVAVSARPPEELREVWRRLAGTDMPLERKAAILAGELQPGMDAEAVRLAWGEPPRRVELAEGLQRWDWPDRSALFRAGSLASWTMKASELPPPRGCGEEDSGAA